MEAICIIIEKDSEKIKAIRTLESLGYKKRYKHYYIYIGEGIQAFFGRADGLITQSSSGNDKESALRYSLTHGYTPISLSGKKFMDIEWKVKL